MKDEEAFSSDRDLGVVEIDDAIRMRCARINALEDKKRILNKQINVLMTAREILRQDSPSAS